IFESALLRLLPPEQLKARLSTMRQEYRDALGDPAYETLRDSLLDLKPDAPDPKKMLAEADNLLGDIHWHYTTTPRLEWQKTGLMLKLGTYLAAVAVLLLLFAWITKSDTVIWVLLAGAIGASISAAQRIQSTKARGNALLCIREAKWHTVSIGLAPMLGALFAFLLMLIFAGEIVSGAAFPNVRLLAKGSCTNLAASVTAANALRPGAADVPAPKEDAKPEPLAADRSTNATNAGAPDKATNTTSARESGMVAREGARAFSSGRQEWCVAGADLALLLLWAFIAGFSERLVPDLLSRISAKAQVKS
ncbi:MAG TPA: hypothetical protein VNT99_01100, partial [Methylomirabilota bacterium]|nr:hypothetical protein [Methylomirabilota bacterium]